MFLAIYLAFIAAAFLVVRTYVWQTDASARLATPPIGASVDPVEIALLRRGPREALRAVVAAMLGRGLLATEDGALAHTSVRASVPADNLEWAIYDATATPKAFAEIARTVWPVLETRLQPCLERLREDELLMPDGLRVRARLLSILVSVVIAGAGAGIGSALAGTVRVAPLFVSIVGSFGILAIWIGGRVPRLSDRGRRYVDALALDFAGADLRERRKADGAALLVALHGTDALANTPLAAARRAMEAPPATRS